MEKESTRILAEIIQRRRTRKPVQFSKAPPSRDLMKTLIDIARHAPNHHRTEPARFYLLDRERIEKVGKLFGKYVAGDGKNALLNEKGQRKTKEWGEAPGILVITCHTERASELFRKNPSVEDEDYATCSCICQNLLLLLESENIASKWSTGAVWKHPEFSDTIDMLNPRSERVVGLIFYGYSDQQVPARSLLPLKNHLQDFSNL